jgi:hypothetical protein
MKIVDPLRFFFLADVCKSHDSSHVMRDTHTNGRGDSAARKVTLRKHSALDGVWVATMGKRAVAVTMSEAQAALGIAPSRFSVAECFNARSLPGDRFVDASNIALKVA